MNNTIRLRILNTQRRTWGTRSLFTSPLPSCETLEYANCASRLQWRRQQEVLFGRVEHETEKQIFAGRPPRESFRRISLSVECVSFLKIKAEKMLHVYETCFVSFLHPWQSSEKMTARVPPYAAVIFQYWNRNACAKNKVDKLSNP